MSRTNIDDEFVTAVMKDYQLKTKREAVDLASTPRPALRSTGAAAAQVRRSDH